jgi:two-component system, chemotaxis family, sensor kinase CheA
MNEFLQQFLIESRELVLQATEGLLLLEKSPADAECLDAVFRAFHTLKGGAGIVEFSAMEDALHSTETLLTEARAGKRTLNAALVGDCLTSLDRVSQWLDSLEQTGELPAVTAVAGVDAVGQDWVQSLVARHSSHIGHAATAFRFTPDRDCFFKGDDPIATVSSMQQLLALEMEPANEWPRIDNFDPYSCNLVLSGLTSSSAGEVSACLRSLSGECQAVSIGTAGPVAAASTMPQIVRDVLRAQLSVLDVKEVAGALGRLASAGTTTANAMRFCGLEAHAETIARATGQSIAEKSPSALRDSIVLLLSPAAAPLAAVPAPVLQRQDSSTRTLRVNASQIDALVRLTGELTVAKNAIGHSAKVAQTNGDSIAGRLNDHHNLLNRLITQLQQSVIGMRVLPLRTVFQRFPRVLREMSSSLGKAVQLRMEGEDTEADKTIVEMLFEPMLHVVRNALDHGVESAETRRASGKAHVATILMRAARDGDRVVIEISDDGAGIDVNRVRQVAKNRGVATEEDLSSMSESEVIDLVFSPGFSTASTVTEISGRGVGMDAVRSAVERVGGRVSIDSRSGQGTAVRFALPFSVMMTRVMTVESSGQIFGIPLDAVVETVRVSREAISGVGAARVIIQRNRTIPIVDLKQVLSAGNELRHSDEGDTAIIIASVAGQWVGICVDQPGERMEVMLKPLDGLLSGMPGIAGTTVLGDGRVLLVLDIAQMLQ